MKENKNQKFTQEYDPHRPKIKRKHSFLSIILTFCFNLTWRNRKLLVDCGFRYCGTYILLVSHPNLASPHHSHSCPLKQNLPSDNLRHYFNKMLALFHGTNYVNFKQASDT